MLQQGTLKKCINKWWFILLKKSDCFQVEREGMRGKCYYSILYWGRLGCCQLAPLQHWYCQGVVN